MCKCGKEILRGLDDDVAALTVVVDPTPVTKSEEIAAVLRGLETCTYVTVTGELWRRNHFHIRGDNYQWPVFVEHRCKGEA